VRVGRTNLFTRAAAVWSAQEDTGGQAASATQSCDAAAILLEGIRRMAMRFEERALGARKGVPLLAIFCLVALGCSSKSDRAEQAYRDAGLQKLDVARVAGIVTVDGGAPSPFTLVMLWDPKKPDGGVFHAICDSNGQFEFTSYERGDGVPPGQYVVLFAQFNPSRRLGEFEPPDLLHNLYNDPDKNTPEHQITVSAPGRDDYHFDLTVAGASPATPGPHSITEIRHAT
jgi:hypothetical protein